MELFLDQEFSTASPPPGTVETVGLFSSQKAFHNQRNPPHLLPRWVLLFQALPDHELSCDSKQTHRSKHHLHWNGVLITIRLGSPIPVILFTGLCFEHPVFPESLTEQPSVSKIWVVEQNACLSPATGRQLPILDCCFCSCLCSYSCCRPQEPEGITQPRVMQCAFDVPSFSYESRPSDT